MNSVTFNNSKFALPSTMMVVYHYLKSYLQNNFLRRRRNEKIAGRETSGINQQNIRALKRRKEKYSAAPSAREILSNLFQTFHGWLLSPCRFAARLVWFRYSLIFSFLILFLSIAVKAQPIPDTSKDDKPPLVVEGVNESDVFGVGRSVVIRGTVKKGAMSFGGDVIVEGTVEGDVATIGGSVWQKEGSRIGGDVIILGGAYHHGKSEPGRSPNSTTIIYAGYEQELRSLMRDPTTIVTPHFSLTFFGQRVLAILFWFIISLALTAVTPNSVSRAVARLHLSKMRVAFIGILAALVSTFGVIYSLHYLPTAISVLMSLLVLILVLLSYIFGRVVIHAATGRWIQKRFLPDGNNSESIALLLGAAFWTIALSLPYIWPLIVALLMSASLGISLTARYRGQ
jgi:hypothetical protein